MPEIPNFNTFENLVAHFGYKVELYKEYLQSLSLDELKQLINKPNFWKSSIKKIMALTIFKYDIAKTKILIENIVENDIEVILNDNNGLRVIMGYIKGNAEALNYFLRLLPKDSANIVLDYLFDSGLDLNLLDFNETNQRIIKEYISKCTSILQMDKIIKSFYRTPHLSTNDLVRFILEEITYDNKFDWFFERFKDSIYPTNPDPDAYYDILSLYEQEQIVEILFLLLNVSKKITEFDDADEEQNYIMKCLGELSKKQSERLIYYLNNLVQCNSYLSTEILKNLTLIQYIESDSIVSSFHPETYDYNYNCVMNNKEYADETLKCHKEMSYEELEKIFFNDDINPNLINRLDTYTLLKIFPFNYFIGLNDKIIDILKIFLGRYFTYERAIFFISLLNLSNSQKIEIITSVYHVSNIDSIELEKNNLVASSMQSLLDQEEPIPDYFKALLPDLIALPYDEAIFEDLKDICLQIDKPEYLQVFLTKYFKHECEKKKMNYWDYHITFSPQFGTELGSVLASRMNIRLRDSQTRAITQETSEHMDTVNHEKTHFYQYDIMPNIISIDSLMVAFAIILSRDKKYYDDNYFNTFHEMHARIYGFYDTYKSLEEFNPDAAQDFLMNDKNLKKEQSTGDQDIVNFLNDRKKAKSIEYFSNLLNTFFEKVSMNEIIEFRKKYKTLELITNEEGKAYTPEEMEGFINEIKASDLKYNAENKSLYTFYIKYLHALNEGLSKSLIDIFGDYKPTRKIS